MLKRRFLNRHSELTNLSARSKNRRLSIQALERRELLAAELRTLAAASFAPGTPQQVVDDWGKTPATPPTGINGGATTSARIGAFFEPILTGNQARWRNSAVGTSPNLGDPITVTWGIVPDGTLTVGPAGTSVASNLIAFMDGIYGGGGTNVVSNKPWFPLINSGYQRWADESGLTLRYESRDDGAQLGAAGATGVIGVRPDMRVSGAPIDGDFGVLAFNYFPNNFGNDPFDGDMVIDTTDIFYQNSSDGPTGPNVALVNVIAHEVGHGIGIAHVEPSNGTKLLEPFINTGFIGPQEDDIFNANILYGDKLESNETRATATNLGNLVRNTPVLVDKVTLDHPTNDSDFYQFTVTAADKLGVAVRPTGSSYLAGPQGGTPVQVDRSTQSNLGFRVYNSAGNLISTVSQRAAGSTEFINGVDLPTAGTYFVEVFAASGQDSQAYELTVQVGKPLEIGPQILAIRPDKSALLQSGDTLNVAPREFNLFFKGGADLDETTINANSVRLIRSGGDGTFGDANDIIVSLGYVGFVKPGSTDPLDRQQIVLRPASSASHNSKDLRASFPDDFYQIQIIGAGAAPLANTSGEAFQGGVDFSTNFRLDRGAQVVSVVPQPISRNTQRINVNPTVTGGTFTLTFQGQTTTPLAFNATNLTIQNALLALTNVQPGDVSVAGTREVTFLGQFAGEQVSLMTTSSASLIGGTVTVSRLTTLTQSSNQIVVYFDDQELNASEVVDPKFYRLINTATTLSANDDRISLPQSVTYDSVDNSAVLTFATAIPEGTYRLDIGQSGGDDATLANAVRLGSLSTSNPFSLVSFLGDAAGASNNGADLDVYNVQLNAGATFNVSVTPHSATLNLRARLLDSAGTQLATVSAGAGATNNLSFAIATTGTYYVEISSVDTSTGSYQLSGSVTGSAISTSDANSTIATATLLGALGAAGVTINSQIQPQSIPLPPLPGGADEPGHRQIQREAHIGATGTTPTVPAATRVIRYYFPDTLGTDTSGNAYLNNISASERQIVREIFEIYALKTGYAFIESAATTPGGADLMIGKGDFRAVSPTLGPNAGVAGLASGGFAIVNGTIYNQSDRFYGDGFTYVMYHEIGHSLGLGHSYELPTVQGAGTPNDVLTGDQDLVHLQRIAPPNSTDIDMYRFDLADAGRFKAETVAERLATPSLLNSVLSLYRQTTGGDLELVARNDQYFGSDAALELTLQPGTYFVGVTSTGNTNFDPKVPDSGFGGTTNGDYQLKLAFESVRDGSLRDVSGTAIDGDADGEAGGAHSFWFQVNDPATTIYVDKLNDTTTNVVNGNGTLANPYDTVDFALKQAGNRIVVPLDGPTSITNGQRFVIDDGINTATFTFGTLGTDPINISAAADANAVAAAIRTAIQNAVTANRLAATVTVTVTGRVVQIGGIDNLDISQSSTLLNTPNLVKIVGNGGADQNINTLADNRPYLIGLDSSGNALADGAEFLVPQGVSVMIHAGALFKLRKANLDAGTSTDVNRSNGAIQVLGTPKNSVFLRSLHDDTVGGNSDGVGTSPAKGNFGGIVFREDSDLESNGVFLNYVNHVDISNGGGKVFVGATESVFTPIHIVDARPTVSFNRIGDSDGSAVSASPDSFDDSLNRIGPDVYGNFLTGNTINGLFIRVETPVGSSIDKLTVSGRLDDTDITHILTENLIIAGAAGGPTLSLGGVLTARAAGRLVVDPGTVLKLQGRRIEAERGAGSLIAEGTINRPVIFTSLADDRYGGSGTFDSNSAVTGTPQAGDWGGLFFGEATSGSIDNALIAYGGGSTPIEGGSASFNAIEVHQASVRVANSLIQDNASGAASSGRNGRGVNAASTIYVRGAQPIIVNNTITDNVGSVISINANSLRFEGIRDTGRSTGLVEQFEQLADNHGPLVRLNRLDNNSINGMSVRGELLTTESIWDDTDIVHVLQSLVTVDNHHTYSGLTLQSSNSESLVVKLAGGAAGFTATGTPLEIIDRIGGTIHVLGTVGHPVILTHLADDTVGAGFTPRGVVNSNTNNSALPSVGISGGWRGFVFDEFSNDRNVAVVRELENPRTNKNDVNSTPTLSQLVGAIAPNEKSGDENRRLGFEVHGYISLNDAKDVDVYSFTGTAGTPVWIDIDRTDTALDAIVEVVSVQGTVLARSVRSGNPSFAGNLNAPTLIQNPLLGGDYYTQNFRDPGLFYVLPATGTHYVRVRSNPASSASVTTLAGESRGKYQLQIRTEQVDEFPGSTIQFADIRFAQTGIDVRGLPAHSPLIGEAGELPAPNDSFDGAQTLVNLLQSDAAALGFSGSISDANDVDWFQFDVRQTGVQVIPGVNDSEGTIAVVLDLDYSDNAAVRGDTTVAVYDEDRNLIYVGRESNVQDDQPVNAAGSIDDLSRGSLGKKDPYVGPIHVTPGGTYYVAVMSDRSLPSALTGAYLSTPTNVLNGLVRLEPINSLDRVVEDHIGLQGYSSGGVPIGPLTPDGLFDITSSVTLANHVKPFRFQDVALYVATDQPETDTSFGSNDQLYTVDPFVTRRWLTRVNTSDALVAGVNDIQDIQIRTDGRFFGYQRLNGINNSVGALVELDASTGAALTAQNDNIPGHVGTPNTSTLNANLGLSLTRVEEFTTSDEVDAVAFQRRGTTGPGSAPVPVYETYYSVRESDRSSKLYRGSQDGNAAPTAAGGGNQKYGVVGDIQLAGVTFASTTLQVSDNATPNANRTTIRIESKIPGSVGNTINLAITRPNNAAANVTSVTGSVTTGFTINLQIGATGGPPATGAPTAAEIVNAINSNAQSRAIVTAVIVGGNGANDGNGQGTGGNGTLALNTLGGGLLTGGSNDAAVAPLSGRVTGLSFANFNSTGSLFGVTNAGEILEINPNSGVVINRIDAANALGIAGLNFQGLTLGPQNVEGGIYKDTLFAVTSTGQLVAFDSTGNGVAAFDSGNAAQLLTVNPGAPTDGFFTLTFNNGTTRQTTAPISATAPSSVSVNESQTLETVAHSGTFTLSFVDDQGATTSPSADVTIGDATINVESTVGFPALTPFVIRVEAEEMLVTARAGNTFTVTRGINGTVAAAHLDTATVFEVVTSALSAAIAAPVSSTVAANIDNLPGSTSLTVASAAAFPAATPYTIRVDNEEMLVTARVGNVLTVTRAQNGTTIAHHNVGRSVQVVSQTLNVVNATPFPAAGFNIRINNEDMRVVSRVGNALSVIRGANGTTAVAHAAAATVSRIDTTGLLQYNSTAAQVRAALGALQGVGGAGNVLVTGGPLTGNNLTPATIQFIGALAAKNLKPLTADLSRLVGDETQTLSLATSASAGAFQLRFGGVNTANIPFNATAAMVQAALEALPAIGAGNVTVTGAALPGAAHTIQFVGALADQNVAAIQVVNNTLTANERQQIAISGVAFGGDFTLTMNDVPNGIVGTTAAIPFNANAAAVQAALIAAIPALAGNINVTGGPLPGAAVTVEFTGTFANTNVTQMTFVSNLVGLTPVLTVTTLGSASIATTRDGKAVLTPMATTFDGVQSVLDALVALPSIAPADIVTAGNLQPGGVSIIFQGAYAGLTVADLEVNNFTMLNGSSAAITASAVPGDGLGDSFVMNVTGINGGGANAVGLTFSPLDFNLWHPTMQRSDDAGHGVNAAPDATRAPGAEDYTVPSADVDRTTNQGAGGASFKFGFEPWVANPGAGSLSYLTYDPAVNAQLGILTSAFHADLSSNPNIRNTYNMPAGGLGTLTTNGFSLTGSVASDRPVLYFNYFLNTEGHGGSSVGSNGNDPFRDSARVYASRDGGTTWELVATNSSLLSAADPTSAPGTAELPGFLSHLSDAGLNSATPRAQNRQIVQELMDNSGQWRQARVDMSTFAGEANVLLRVDFTTAGAFDTDATLGTTNTNFGEFMASGGSPRSIRSTANNFEGFYVDDFIVGYAERGEMVTGTNPDVGITNLFGGGARTSDNDPGAFPDVVNGAYQIEVRRTDEYGVLTDTGVVVGSTFDTNDRHVNEASQTAAISFEPSTTVPSLVPVDTTLLGVTIPAIAIAPWSVSSTTPFTGTRNLQSGTVNATTRPVSIFQATRAELGSATNTAGVIRFAYSVNSALNLHGLRFFIDGVPQTLNFVSGDDVAEDPTLASGDTGYQIAQFGFGSGNPTFTWVYDFTDPALAQGLNRAFIDDIQLLQGGTGLLADRNRERPQGIFIVDSNFITNSEIRGINVQPGTTQAGGSVPHPGSTINFPQLNTERLVPGVVIQNNVIAGSSGIRFAGENTNNPQRPVPFGRIVNNTLVGRDQNGIGVEVVGLASPTLMNNLLNNLGIGISNGGTGTVIQSNFFQGNTANGAIGNASIVAAAAAPLFVDAANRNYYLVSGSTAIDSSQDVEQERFNFASFKKELGIPESPINAPNRDVYGQLRIDSGSTPTGGGATVFKDRGAVDRSDKDAPYAQLLNPVDNDAAGLDRDPNETVVYLTDPLLENFTILLGDGSGPNSPFQGTGVNGLTVDDASDLAVAARAVTIVHDGTTLVQGVDYTLGYNPLTGVLLLTPLSTLWEQTGVYTITLDNTQIADLAGNRLRSNQTDGTTRFFILMPDVRLDFGDAPDSFKTLLASNAARHTIQPGATPRLGRRIDSEPNGFVDPASDDGSQAVSISTNAPTKFIVTGTIANGRTIAVTSNLPTGGEQVSVTIGLATTTFELVAAGFAPQRGNVAVPLLTTDTAATIAARLSAAINASLVKEGDGAVVAVDSVLSNTINVETFDDEDGVSVGTYNNGLADYIVFLKPGAPEFTLDPADVLGFLNPLDELGTTISVNASSAGLLDAWIDFNGDGAFGVDEQIFKNQPLVVGDNTLKIVTPLNTVDGTRWSRFRISEFGNLAPDELAIGGEVEDYLVQVINVPPTIPADDTFSVNEDAILNTETTLTLASLFDNDPMPVEAFLPPRFIVDTQPIKGTLTITDPLTGRFVYTPFADFHGQDVFTYWVSTQPVPGTVLPPNVELATVTINVVPVNDAPLATNKSFPALEDTAVTITAAQLLVGAIADASPQYPTIAAPTAPWNEINQRLSVVAITIQTTTGPVVVTSANAATGPFVTTRGSFVVNFVAGILTNLVYTPAQDLNRDNNRGVGAPILQTFQFTIRDSGESIDPDNGATIPGTPLEHTATTSINVAPRNDAPTPFTDNVSVGVVGTTNTNTLWRQHFVGLNQAVPVPTEDTTLVIPSAFLLKNDLAGSVTAIDENLFISNNDAPLRIISVAVNNRNAAVSLDVNGNVVFVPPTDVYGDVVFTYVVQDSGVDEALNGTRTVVPRTATGTATVTIQPINDVPVTFNRSVTFTESNAPGVDSPAHTFTALQLINGTATEADSIPGLFAANLPAPFNETEQLASLRVVRFTTTAGSVDGATLPGGNGTLRLNSDAGGRYEFDFTAGAFTIGRFFPAADYNQRTPFAATERFQFVVEDNGATTDPQLGNVVTLPRQRSLPVTTTITVLQSNDAPLFTMPSGFTFNENTGTAVTQTNFITAVSPGPLSALDELARQNVTITFAAINVPTGLMTALPTITVVGSAGNWPGTGNLTVFPAADAYGYAVYRVTAIDNDPTAPRTAVQTLTITINPINDVPVAFNRNISVAEAVEVDGRTAVLTFTAAGLINGVAPELRNVAGSFPPALIAPYNEIEQTLRVVAFNVPGAAPVDVTSLVGGTGSITRTTLNNSRLTFNFNAGAFVDGTYAPPVDYNQRTPFVANETFTYVISDNGRTTLPGSGFINLNGSSTNSTITIPEQRSVAATITVTTTPANDPPIFSSIPVLHILERDDNGGTVIPNFVFNVQPAPSTALDELQRQTVSFVVQTGAPGTSIPAGLMRQNPQFLPNGSLVIFPAPDAVGTAVYVFDAVDAEAGTAGFVPRATRGMVTVNVRPVNDAPRLSPVAGTSLATNADERWAVNATTGTITYTLKEDNTGAGGSTSPYVLDARRTNATANRVGLLDPYTVGPANEADATLGGQQILRIISVDALTSLGGTLTAVDTDADGFVDRVRYVPPVDYNSAQGPVDTFTYVFEDNAPNPLGETWSLATLPGNLIENRLTRVGTVQLLLNPVNDQPLFSIPTLTHSVLEDAGAVIVPGFATDILPGPLTAGDELANQTVTFTLTPMTPENGLFSVSPSIGADGNLTFTSAPDAVGSIRYVVTMNDSGLSNNPRGDINSLGPVTITINVRPVNDQPRTNPSVVGTSKTTSADEAWTVSNTGVITYTLKEDNTGAAGATSPFVIDVRRTASTADRIGLLDPFVVGPANEIDSTLGGLQTLRVLTVPATTTLGGTLTATRDANNYVTRVTYVPPANYNSLQGARDSFDYVVEDDAIGLGETFNLGNGTLLENRLRRSSRVEFTLNPVNDAPLFTIPTATRSVLEDSGAVTVAGFAANILPGPATAIDEANQTLAFNVVPQAPENGLFAVSPAISVSGTLTFTPNPDQVGSIVYAVTLVDNGATNPARGDLNSRPPVLVTVNVRPVNDPPRLNAAVVGTSFTTNANEAWQVDNAGLITYTLGEDNTQSIGVNPPYVIDINRSASANGRIGLLDVFTVGPTNESDTTLGGSQVLRIIDVPTETILGGTLRVVARDANNHPTRIEYTPPANYNSLQGISDSFEYTVEDDATNRGETFNLATGLLVEDRLPRTGRVQFVLNPLNDAPEFTGAASVTVSEDSTAGPVIRQTVVTDFVSNIAAGPLDATDERAAGTGQTVTFTVSPAAGNPAGLFSTAPTVSPTGTLSFITAPDANGVATFTIVAVDSGSNAAPRQTNTSAPKTFTITVTSANDAPTFTAGPNVTVAEDSGAYSRPTPYATNISPGAPNEVTDGQTVRFDVSIPQAGRALFAVLPSISTTGFLTFTPADDAVGSVVLSVTAVDSLNAVSAPTLLTITITEINDVPIANNFTVSGDEDNAIVITSEEFISNAVDPDLLSNLTETLTVTQLSTTSVSGAAVSINSSGGVVYDPRNAATLQALRPGQTVTDTITYRLSDRLGSLSERATITINVAGRNDAPITVDDSAVLLTGPVSSTLRPLSNDRDIDGTVAPGTIIITEQPVNGSLSVQTDGTLIYTPTTGFRGLDSISYTVADDRGQQSEQATISLDIAPAPTSANITTGTLAGQPIVVDVATGFNAPAGTLDLTSIVITTPPTSGVVTILANGQIRYTPNAGFVGADTFAFTISDTKGRRSSPVVVTMNTVSSQLQNPRSFFDVDANGTVAGRDALLILNRLGRASRAGQGNTIPVLSTDAGPSFFDVDGNRTIASLDALKVLNFMARQRRNGRASEGEALRAAPELQSQSIDVMVNQIVDPVSTNMVPTVDADLIASEVRLPSDEMIEWFAWDAGQEDDKDVRRANQIESLDAAFLELDL